MRRTVKKSDQPIYTGEFDPGDEISLGLLTVVVLKQRSGRKVRLGVRGAEGAAVSTSTGPAPQGGQDGEPISNS